MRSQRAGGGVLCDRLGGAYSFAAAPLTLKRWRSVPFRHFDRHERPHSLRPPRPGALLVTEEAYKVAGVSCRIPRPLDAGHLFGSHIRQPQLVFRDHHRLLAQKRIVVARADGIHDLLDLFCYGRITAGSEGSEPVPAGITACASLAGAGSRSTALAPVNPVGCDLFLGRHCGPSTGAIDGTL